MYLVEFEDTGFMRKIVLGIALLFFVISPVFAESGACDDELVLGYFFQNGEEPAIVTRDGSILFNPNHDMEVFIEVCDEISEVKVSDGEDFLDLHYDSDAALWFGVFTEDFLAEERNSLNVLVNETELDFVDVLNVKEFEETDEVAFLESEIYKFSGYQWEKLEYSEDNIIYPIFSLPSGRYYARISDESSWFYSSIIDLDETTIVSFSYGERKLPVFFNWLSRYFSPLEQEFFSSDYSSDYGVDAIEKQDFHGIERYVDFERNTLFMYINSWNPIYEEYLVMFESISDEYEIILFTDSNNFDPVEEMLEDVDGNIVLYQIEGLLLESLVVWQPKIYFYDSDTEEILGFFRARDLNILK